MAIQTGVKVEAVLPTGIDFVNFINRSLAAHARVHTTVSVDLPPVAQTAYLLATESEPLYVAVVSDSRQLTEV